MLLRTGFEQPGEGLPDCPGELILAREDEPCFLIHLNGEITHIACQGVLFLLD
jgi:hypothetical protein